MTNGQIETPVAFIVFNRLDCTQEVFAKIREAQPTKLYVIADGARENRPGEDEKVKAVREYIESGIDWECDVKYNYADKNMGCKYRIYSGLNWVFEHEEKAIILEDDCVPNMDFFEYCQELLQLYEKDEDVWLIGGTNLTRNQQTKETYFFTKFPDIWGWATWKRAWTQCDIEMDSWKIAKKSGAIKYVYDFWSYRCYLRVADHQVRLKRDTWDVPWVYTMHYHHGVGISPSENMISNVGCGRTDASNTTEAVNFDFSYGKKLEFPLKKINEIKVDRKFDKAYLRQRWGWKKEKQYLTYLISRIIPKMKEMLGK